MKIGSVNSNNQSQSFGINYSKKAHAKIMEFCKTPDLKAVLDNFATKDTKLRRIIFRKTKNGDILELKFRLRTLNGTQKMSTQIPFNDKSEENLVNSIKLGVNRVEQKFITNLLRKSANDGVLTEIAPKLKQIYPHRNNFITQKSNNYFPINSKNYSDIDETKMQKTTFLEKLLSKIML